jgi:hypothetical protein
MTSDRVSGNTIRLADLIFQKNFPRLEQCVLRITNHDFRIITTLKILFLLVNNTHDFIRVHICMK